jgi:hypothetical protein
LEKIAILALMMTMPSEGIFETLLVGPNGKPTCTRFRRPPSAADRKRNDKRQRRRLAQREYRRRFDDGRIVVAVEIDGIDGADVDMLIANDWLDRGCDDRKKIAKAIAAMLAEAAKR